MIPLLLLSCDQSDILYRIEVTPKPRDPVIAGSPGEVLDYNGRLYVSNGRIHVFENQRWTPLPGQPAGTRVQAITATTGFLYARIGTSPDISGDKIYRYNGAWDELPLPESGGLSAIHGAGDTLFISTTDSKSYYLTDTAGAFTEIPGPPGSSLIGAAAYMGGDYYLSIMDEGVYAGPSPANLSRMAGNDLDTLINFALDAAAPALYGITANSTIAEITGPAGVTLHSPSIPGSPTGAIAVFKGALLVGRRYTGSYTYGYVEVKLSDFSVYEDLPESVSPEAWAGYSESLGRRVINHLFVTAEGEIFASTQLKGLWVCRKNGEVWEWGIEDRGN
jgi:hypothetical protein